MGTVRITSLSPTLSGSHFRLATQLYPQHDWLRGNFRYTTTLDKKKKKEKKKNHCGEASYDIKEFAVWFRCDASMREVAAIASRVRSRFRSWIKHPDSSISKDSDLCISSMVLFFFVQGSTTYAHGRHWKNNMVVNWMGSVCITSW